MVPRAVVLTNENSGARPVTRPLRLLLAAWMIGIAGCSPPGPKTLLEGKKALDEGRYPEAVARMERAVTLLPKKGVAWNYLGLAYQHNRQLDQAVRAYRTALSLDRNLSIARYNLGCVYLEQENVAAAAEELRSYTLLQPAAAEGWIRLGTALFRGRRLEEAERSFRAALELHPRHPEALNGLGLIQLQRRRWQEALNHFNAAALQEPPYPPAVLNSAIVAQQLPNQRHLALQRYRQYLALAPRQPDWESVEATARQLEVQINPNAGLARASPPPTAPVYRTNPPAQATAPAPGKGLTTYAAAARTNPPAASALPKPNLPGSPSFLTNASVATVKPLPESARPAAAATPTLASAPSSTSAPTHPHNPFPAAGPPPARPTEIPPAKPVEIEIAQVPPTLIVKPAQELSHAGSSSVPPLTAPSTALSNAIRLSEPTSAPPRGSIEPARRNLLARLNPFTGHPKSPADTEPAEANPTNASRPPDPGPVQPVPRYTYLSPAPPTPGSRAEGEKSFRKGLRSQQAGNRSQAILEYQGAVRDDPAYYDAYYNLGLAALDTGNLSLALWAYEIALALRPDDDDARYNFALALKSGGYWLDAVEELNRNLSRHPDDLRSHLSIANLYSQQLHEPSLARPHYERVLDLNPRHSEASRIRFWLGANP